MFLRKQPTLLPLEPTAAQTAPQRLARQQRTVINPADLISPQADDAVLFTGVFEAHGAVVLQQQADVEACQTWQDTLLSLGSCSEDGPLLADAVPFSILRRLRSVSATLLDAKDAAVVQFPICSVFEKHQKDFRSLHREVRSASCRAVFCFVAMSSTCICIDGLQASHRALGKSSVETTINLQSRDVVLYSKSATLHKVCPARDQATIGLLGAFLDREE